jgi:nucleolin
MTSIFLGNLSWGLDESALTEAITQFAQPESVDIKRYKGGKSIGYAIASFASEEDAQVVIDNMNGMDLDGREVNCREDRGARAPKPQQQQQQQQQRQQQSASTPGASNTVFVGNLTWDTTDENLMEIFQDFNVLSATVQRQPNGNSKGWALATFDNVDDTAAAISELNGIDVDGREIVCREDRGSRGGPRRQRQPRERRVLAEGAPSTSVFVGNLNWDMTDEGLDELLSDFQVDEASVQTRDDGKSRGYALVRFASIEESERAISELNGQEVLGRNLLLKFDAKA